MTNTGSKLSAIMTVMAYPAERKNKVVALRLEGMSINKIAEQEALQKSTVSLWVRNVVLPGELRRHLINNALEGRKRGLSINEARRSLARERLTLEARKEMSDVFAGRMDAAQARILASLLYWCEGGKRKATSVKFINSDPQLVKSFLHLFRKGFLLNEKKFRCCVHLHDYHDVGKQVAFWSGISGIPPSQFMKPYIKPNTGVRKREGYQGCLSVSYYDSSLAQKLTALYHAFAEMGA